MAQYRVRKHFTVRFKDKDTDTLHPEGTILELTLEEYNKVAHQVEEWPIAEIELKEKKEVKS